jgi:hypothetical protein
MRVNVAFFSISGPILEEPGIAAAGRSFLTRRVNIPEPGMQSRDWSLDISKTIFRPRDAAVFSSEAAF